MPSSTTPISIEQLIEIYNAGRGNQAFLVDLARALEVVAAEKTSNTDHTNDFLLMGG